METNFDKDTAVALAITLIRSGLADIHVVKVTGLTAGQVRAHRAHETMKTKRTVMLMGRVV